MRGNPCSSPIDAGPSARDNVTMRKPPVLRRLRIALDHISCTSLRSVGGRLFLSRACAHAECRA